MKKFAKEFLISSAFIWVLYYITFYNGFFITKEELIEESELLILFVFPLVLLTIILSGFYIFFIFRKDNRRFQKTNLYLFLSWSVLFLLVIATPSSALWIQNQVYYGGQSKELKQELIKKAEKSLEKKMNKKYKLVSSEYRNNGRFGDMLFDLEFKEEGNKKDFQTTTVYVSHKKQGWRLKILNGDIWYIDK